jgi:hypothetical protein
MAAFQAQVLDVRAGGLRYPQPVERKQRDQRVLSGRPEPGSDEEGAELVAVQSGGVRLVVQPRSADVRRRGVLEELFFDGVLVEPGDGAQPPVPVPAVKRKANVSRLARSRYVTNGQVPMHGSPPRSAPYRRIGAA